MTPLGWILLGVAICYIGLASWCASRAYNRDYGDGFNYASDRTTRAWANYTASVIGRLAPVPESPEVERERQRRERA